MNLLVTGAWSCTKAQLDTLAQMGHQVTFMQYEKDLMIKCRLQKRREHEGRDEETIHYLSACL